MGELVQLSVSQAPAQGGIVQVGLMLAVMLGIIYFMLIRPQNKQRNEHETLISALKKGDEVMLNSGIFGKIVAVNGNTLLLEVADKTRVKVLATAVHGLADRFEKRADGASAKSDGKAANKAKA